MKIQHMRKQWIPGPSFFFPARSAPRASLRAKKEGLGTRLKNPVRVSLGTHHVWKKNGPKRRLVEVSDYFMYVPIKDVLERMLQNDTIFEEVCIFY